MKDTNMVLFMYWHSYICLKAYFMALVSLSVVLYKMSDMVKLVHCPNLWLLRMNYHPFNLTSELSACFSLKQTSV